MIDIINNVLWTFQNILKVIPKDLAQFNQEIFINIAIQGALVFAMFYFPSKWFKAYIIRLFLFVIGILVFWSVCQRESMLFSFDFYGSIGIFLPHIEIVEITYLIFRERTLFLYDKITERKAEQEYHKEEFEKQQKEAHQQEQAKYYNEDMKRQDNQKKFKYHQEKREEPPTTKARTKNIFKMGFI